MSDHTCLGNRYPKELNRRYLPRIFAKFSKIAILYNVTAILYLLSINKRGYPEGLVKLRVTVNGELRCMSSYLDS